MDDRHPRLSSDARRRRSDGRENEASAATTIPINLRFSYDGQIGETTQIHTVGIKGSARF